MLELSESINVWVFFHKAHIEPYVFFWKGRRIKIDKINMVHTKKDPSGVSYFFSVSNGQNFYRLKFEMPSLKWFLEAVEEDT
jgi:hypothetical protein